MRFIPVANLEAGMVHALREKAPMYVHERVVAALEGESAMR